MKAALDELDARYREHQSTIKPGKKDILAGGYLLMMTRAGPLDVLSFIGDQKRYEDLIDASSKVSIASGSIRVLNLDELIRQKKATDRPKDRAVIELLEEVVDRQRHKD